MEHADPQSPGVKQLGGRSISSSWSFVIVVFLVLATASVLIAAIPLVECPCCKGVPYFSRPDPDRPNILSIEWCGACSTEEGMLRKVTLLKKWSLGRNPDQWPRPVSPPIKPVKSDWDKRVEPPPLEKSDVLGSRRIRGCLLRTKADTFTLSPESTVKIEDLYRHLQDRRDDIQGQSKDLTFAPIHSFYLYFKEPPLEGPSDVSLEYFWPSPMVRISGPRWFRVEENLRRRLEEAIRLR